MAVVTVPVGESTDPSQLSLTEFRSMLALRLADSKSALARLIQLQDRRPRLGRFEHAQKAAALYSKILAEEISRARRLVTALQAAVDGTDAIIANYRTTEKLNRALSAQIAAQLQPVGEALTGGG